MGWRVLSAVAVHTVMQGLKPALHMGRRNDGHPESETLSNVTRNWGHVAAW